MIPMPSVSEAGSELEDIQEMTSGEEDQMIKHIDGMQRRSMHTKSSSKLLQFDRAYLKLARRSLA
jgi:hypothetical protein